MGRKTYQSLPNDPRLFKNRMIIIVTSIPSVYKNDSKINVMFMTMEHMKYLDSLDLFSSHHKNIFFLGGENIFKYAFMRAIDHIYMTQVDQTITNASQNDGTFFPIEKLDHYVLDSYNEAVANVSVGGSGSGDMHIRFLKYKHMDLYEHPEGSYLGLIRKLYIKGNVRDDRTGTGTLSLFAENMRFDISTHFPLITTKKMPWKMVLKELLFFLQGKTDSKLLEKQGVPIWKANTTREFLDHRGLNHYAEGDMGPMYGFNWRHYGADYSGCHASYDGRGYDQLSALIAGLKTDPFSRRHMITTYNPAQVDISVLAPCHGIISQFYVEEDSTGTKHLSCHVYCRSHDMILGSPFNIASYAALVYIIAKKVSMCPKELVLSLGDCHLYKNHIEQAKTQMERVPLPLPILRIDDSVIEKDFAAITLDDFELIGYISHPPIQAPMAV
jgi:thymidylate synthase